MAQSLVHWEMMEFLHMKTLVVSLVTLVMSLSAVTLGPVRVMGAGVVVRPVVGEKVQKVCWSYVLCKVVLWNFK